MNGGPISWASRRQTVTAQSTSEAELVALSTAAKELVWLRSLLMELDVFIGVPTPVYEDNQATIVIANGSGLSSRTKHIDVRYFYVREQIENERIRVEYCTSATQLADMFTKAVPAEKLRLDCSRFMTVLRTCAFMAFVPMSQSEW